MHRQSLGPPSSKLLIHGGAATAKQDTLTAEEPKRRDDEGAVKSPKTHRLSSSLSSPQYPPRPEKFIHLIPILTLLCFLILYLSSHTPSPSELAHFPGLKRSSVMDIDEMMEYNNNNEAKKGDILAIRSFRNLREIENHPPKHRSHRKFADI